MDHFVKLDRLPDAFEFPSDLKERFCFDAEAQKLVFHGYMSKADFDRVSQLTTDWKFRRILEDLFRLCIPEEAPRPGRVPKVLANFTRRFLLG